MNDRAPVTSRKNPIYRNTPAGHVRFGISLAPVPFRVHSIFGTAGSPFRRGSD